jgi:uncharacterized membrane protein YebE (DUF533 family)
MIIFGTRGITRTRESGQFHCPGCGGAQQFYTRKTVRRFFTLYFVPIIPLNTVGEYIECQRCHNSYNEQVLQYDPAAQQAKQRAEFVEHLKRVMVLTALAGGHVEDAQREAIRQQYQSLSGKVLSAEELERELALGRQGGITPADYSRRFAGALNDRGKEIVIKSAQAVLAAGGALEQPQYDLLQALATALEVSEAHLRGILSGFDEA